MYANEITKCIYG